MPSKAPLNEPARSVPLKGFEHEQQSTTSLSSSCGQHHSSLGEQSAVELKPIGDPSQAMMRCGFNARTAGLVGANGRSLAVGDLVWINGYWGFPNSVFFEGRTIWSRP